MRPQLLTVWPVKIFHNLSNCWTLESARHLSKLSRRNETSARILSSSKSHYFYTHTACNCDNGGNIVPSQTGLRFVFLRFCSKNAATNAAKQNQNETQESKKGNPKYKEDEVMVSKPAKDKNIKLARKFDTRAIVKEDEYEEKDPVEKERHIYWKSKSLRALNKKLMNVELFESLTVKNKENFIAAVEVFKAKDVRVRYVC